MVLSFEIEKAPKHKANSVWCVVKINSVADSRKPTVRGIKSVHNGSLPPAFSGLLLTTFTVC